MSRVDFKRSLFSGPLPRREDLSQEELEQLLWSYRGVLKEQQRERAFWAATNDNLASAFERLAEKDRELERAYRTIQEDLAVANRIQESLLPVPPPAMATELEVAVFHRQLADVGGDYYDFFPLESGRYAVGVFDISGHGVSAALVMTYLKSQFMTVLSGSESPAQIVESVNRQALSFMQTVKKYAAVNFIAFGPQNIRYTNGGGNGILVSGTRCTEFTKVNQFLGLRPKPFHEYEVEFRTGDLLALYTDGIPEAQDELGADFTKKRLNNLIVSNRKLPVEEIVGICEREYARFRAHDSDDITLLLLRRKG